MKKLYRVYGERLNVQNLLKIIALSKNIPLYKTSWFKGIPEPTQIIYSHVVSGVYTKNYRPWKLAALIYGNEPLTKANALRIEWYTKAKNYTSHPKKALIPTDCPVRKRIWLINQSILEVSVDCEIMMIDSEMQNRQSIF